MNEPQAAMIIGASRGIGLALAREFAARGWHVIASERSRSASLHELAAASDGRVEIVTADVTDRSSIAAPTASQPATFDVVLVNAGIYDGRSVNEAEDADVAHIMLTNTTGPIRTGRALLPLLRAGGRLGFTTSLMGSITDSSGGAELYRMSKAAQNILARGLFEQEAKALGVAVLSLHPGWVKTDMGGDNAPVSVEDSARGLADVLGAPQPLAHRFLDFRGRELPW
jgi:NAD(P)-dependent dehydrogenase (short-subunit alcohol dehydrogenase family)